jgi:Putative quorum-sensing-regulated virulence factor
MSGFAADVWVRLQLRPIEAKLLALALDPAARGNEIATSAEKIISLLRARGVSTAQVFRVSKPTSAVAGDTTLARALAMRMPFGKHRHKLLRDIPLSYLHWARDNCRNMSASLRDSITVILQET